MKQFIKIAALLFMLGASTEAWAQLSDNADITASAEVVQQMEVLGVNDLLFDLVVQGTDKTVALDGTVVTGGTTGNEQAGQFTVSASAGTSVDLEFTSLPANLDITGGGVETMPISFSATDAGYDLDSDVSDGTIFDPNSSVNIPSFPVNDIGGTTNAVYVGLAGTVQPDASQVEGTYEATVTLTATYN